MKNLLLLCTIAGLAVTPACAATYGQDQAVAVYVTLYGSPDNDPPNSGAIAHPNRLHKVAGGLGTFADPVTFAVKKGWLPVYTKIYYPALKKYFINEDDCASCNKNHVDLWAGYGTRRGGILRCERALTENDDVVIVNPSAEYPVDPVPIWDEKTKQCQNPYN